MNEQKRIILLHGWGAHVGKLTALMKSLKELNWDTHVIKLPGFDLLPPKNVWGIGEYADYVLGEAQKIYGKEKFFVFGHSFGGRIVIKLAEKYNGQLSGLILCSTAGLSRAHSPKRAIFFVLAKIGKVFLFIPPLARFWKKLLYKLAKEHDYERAQGMMKAVLRKVVVENLKPVVRKIKIPILVLWGKKDRITPVVDAHYIKKILPSTKLIIFKDEDHKLPYSKPRKLAKEIDKWIKDLK